MSPWSIENERVQCSPCAGMPKSTVFHTDIYTLHIPFHSITLHHITLQYTKQYTLPKDRAVLLSSCFTRRTARARSLDHQRVTRPRLRIIEAEMQGFSTGYLRVLSGTIEYNRELREVGCELRRSNNSARSLATAQHSTVQYSTVQYSTVQYSTVQYSTVQYSTVQYSTVQYSTVQYSTVQYSTVQYSTVQYSTVQYSTVQYNGAEITILDDLKLVGGLRVRYGPEPRIYASGRPQGALGAIGDLQLRPWVAFGVSGACFASATPARAAEACRAAILGCSAARERARRRAIGES